MIALLASMLVAATAGAPAPAELCPETTRLEREIADGQRFRRDFGMPASRAHVVKVLRSGAKPPPGGGVPLSPREAGYMQRRDRLSRSPAFRRVFAYGPARPATFAGFKVGNDYPRGGVAVVRFTRGVARHRAALERIAPFPVRVQRVRFSERELRRVKSQLDHKALLRQGIDLLSVEALGLRNRVVVDYVSRREDASAVIRRPFGAIIVARRLSRRPTYLDCTPVGSARIADDDRTLTLHYTTGMKAKFERVFVDEEADRVRVGVIERHRYGLVLDIGFSAQATAVLAEPLGDRALVDALTGEPLRQP